MKKRRRGAQPNLEAEGEASMRELLEIGRRISELFEDSDPAEASIVLREAARLVDGRRAHARGRRTPIGSAPELGEQLG